MRIVNLIENTEGAAGCGCEHGLSFYIETEHHKLLMDTGQTDLFIRNAEKLGIDLTRVDTVVLSHGHYDHGGGILALAGINPDAKIYVQASAFGEYYAEHEKREPSYIGLAEGIRELPQVVIVGDDGTDPRGAVDRMDPREAIGGGHELNAEGIFYIDDELSLFSGIGNQYPIPVTNQRLKVKTEEGYAQDDFRHEQCLVIHEGDKTVMLSGCAHHGILNIMERYRELYGGAPDVVISGFHMMKRHGYGEEDINQIIDTALALRRFKKTVFYTGHCTGEAPYEAMKKLMGDQLRYVHSGDEIKVRTGIERIAWETAHSNDQEAPSEKISGEKVRSNKKRRSYMKCHKFFAWATVACFVMTMVTGYKKK